MNKVVLMGRLCADPEFRQTTGGTPCCRFRIAVDRPKAKDAPHPEADFINVVAWRARAEFISRYFAKGSRILIEGQMRNNDYTDNNGTKHYGIEVLADNVEFCESKQQDSGSQAAPAEQYGQPPVYNPGYTPPPPAPQQYQQAPPTQYQQQYQAPPQFGAVPPPNNNPYHPN